MNLKEICVFLQPDEPSEEDSQEVEIKKSAGLSDENKELLIKSIKANDYFAKKIFDPKATNKIKDGLEQTSKVDVSNDKEVKVEDNNKTVFSKGGRRDPR